jgi:hypothetical protein
MESLTKNNDLQQNDQHNVSATFKKEKIDAGI